MTDAETSTPAAIAFAADTLGRDLLDTIMQHVSDLPGWNMASSTSKETALRDFKGAVERMVRETIQVVGSGQFPACPATLTSVSFGDKITARLTIDRSATGRHDLVDMAGLPVIVLMAAPDDYLARMQDVRARSSQRELFPAVDPDVGLVDGNAPAANYQGIGETGGEIRESVANSERETLRFEEPCVCSHTRTDHVGLVGKCTFKGCGCKSFLKDQPPTDGTDFSFGKPAADPQPPNPENHDDDEDGEDEDDDE